MADETPAPTPSIAISWRQMCLRRDPDYAVESEIVPEYEFRGKENKRVFPGTYRQRGAYAE